MSLLHVPDVGRKIERRKIALLSRALTSDEAVGHFVMTMLRRSLPASVLAVTRIRAMSSTGKAGGYWTIQSRFTPSSLPSTMEVPTKSAARISWSNGPIGSRIRVNTPSTSYESCFQAWSSFERRANWMRFER